MKTDSKELSLTRKVLSQTTTAGTTGRPTNSPREQRITPKSKRPPKRRQSVDNNKQSTSTIKFGKFIQEQTGDRVPRISKEKSSRKEQQRRIGRRICDGRAKAPKEKQATNTKQVEAETVIRNLYKAVTAVQDSRLTGIEKKLEELMEGQKSITESVQIISETTLRQGASIQTLGILMKSNDDTMRNNQNETEKLIKELEERMRDVEKRASARAMTAPTGSSPNRKTPRQHSPEKATKTSWDEEEDEDGTEYETPIGRNLKTALYEDFEEDEFGDMAEETQEEREHWDSHPEFSANKKGGPGNDGAAQDK